MSREIVACARIASTYHVCTVSEQELLKDMVGSIAKGTLHISALFGYDKIEATQIEWGFVDYAQYRNAVRVTLLPKRMRRRRELTKGSPKLIILEGWGHPNPPGKFKPGDPISGFVHKVSRRLSCADEWDTEFDLFLQAYLNVTGAKIAVDFRRFKTDEKS